MKQKKPLPAWTPFERAVPKPMHPEVIARMKREHGEEETARQLKLMENTPVYLNSRYQVHVQEHPPTPMGRVVSLSIKNRDKSARHDWRDLQRIKNEICGEECEAVELYPAESRVVDEANQFHLFVFPPGYLIPLGYSYAVISDQHNPGGSQRPFEKGHPWLSDLRLNRGPHCIHGERLNDPCEPCEEGAREEKEVVH